MYVSTISRYKAEDKLMLFSDTFLFCWIRCKVISNSKNVSPK